MQTSDEKIEAIAAIDTELSEWISSRKRDGADNGEIIAELRAAMAICERP